MGNIIIHLYNDKQNVMIPCTLLICSQRINYTCENIDSFYTSSDNQLRKEHILKNQLEKQGLVSILKPLPNELILLNNKINE